jgi:large subunit ribosomal protein L29
MKARELREMDADELVRKQGELKDQLFKLRFQHELGQVENFAKLRTIKKDLAKIATVLGEIGKKAKA